MCRIMICATLPKVGTNTIGTRGKPTWRRCRSLAPREDLLAERADDTQKNSNLVLLNFIPEHESKMRSLIILLLNLAILVGFMRPCLADEPTTIRLWKDS